MGKTKSNPLMSRFYVAEVWPLASLQTSIYSARKAASAPESRSTVSTLSTFSSQSTSANGYRFLALTLWYHVGTNLAFEGDATFECMVRGHVEDHNARLHAGAGLRAPMNLLASADAAATAGNRRGRNKQGGHKWKQRVRSKAQVKIETSSDGVES